MTYIFLLYLADIIEKLSGVLTFFGIAGVCACGVLFVVMTICIDVSFDEDDINDYKKYRLLSLSKLYIPILIVILATIIPSKTFIYTAVAIKAGVEITAEIRANPIVSKGLRVVEQYLDDTLAQKE